MKTSKEWGCETHCLRRSITVNGARNSQGVLTPNLQKHVWVKNPNRSLEFFMSNNPNDCREFWSKFDFRVDFDQSWLLVKVWLFGQGWLFMLILTNKSKLWTFSKDVDSRSKFDLWLWLLVKVWLLTNILTFDFVCSYLVNLLVVC